MFDRGPGQIRSMIPAKRYATVLSTLLVFAGRATAQHAVVADPALSADIDRRTAAIADKVTGWRHDIHQHPELGYAEKRTSAHGWETRFVSVKCQRRSDGVLP